MENKERMLEFYLLLPLLLSSDVSVDTFSDCQFAGSLANFCQVSSRESLGHPGQEWKIHFLANWRLSQVGLQDCHSGSFIWQRNVDQLVKTSRSEMNEVLE